MGGLPSNLESNDRLVASVGLHANNVSFAGCIRKFKLGLRVVKIQSASEPLGLRRIGIEECEPQVEEKDVISNFPAKKVDVCSPDPCLNEGRCSEAEEGFYRCECSVGFEGVNCELKSE